MTPNPYESPAAVEDVRRDKFDLFDLFVLIWEVTVWFTLGPFTHWAAEYFDLHRHSFERGYYYCWGRVLLLATVLAPLWWVCFLIAFFVLLCCMHALGEVLPW